MSGERVRLDVWLWRARFLKTRTQCAELVSAGGVRLARQGNVRRVEKPAEAVGPGDVLVLAQRGEMRSVRIEALGARRGPPAEARALYADLGGALDGESPARHVSGAADDKGPEPA